MSDKLGPAIENHGRNTMLESWRWISSFEQVKIPNFRSKKSYQIPVEIRQIVLKPDRNRNRNLKPDFRSVPRLDEMR